MEYVTRIHLKTDGIDRNELINYCLYNENQCLAIGWSSIYYSNTNISKYKDFYYAVKDRTKRVPHVLNTFWYAKPDDLFWTRDLNGYYWICRATGSARPKYIKNMDIGAIIPIEAYKSGTEVPGQIKASFNRPRGGTCQEIKNENIIEYSKYIYNQLSGKEYYDVKKSENHLLDNLPDFDLEELVISYLQIKENYYVLSNSIANKSTTIKIECELIGRDKEIFKKAVVQVKGGKTKEIDASDYLSYDQDGYNVYLYAPKIKNADRLKNCTIISQDDLLLFYNAYKNILPNSITKWEALYKI